VAFTRVTLTRTYQDADGAAAMGMVRLTPTSPMVNGLTIIAAAVDATLNDAGVATWTNLAANTDPDTIPTGSAYWVEERIVGQAARKYVVRIPHDAGSTVDLSTLDVFTAPELAEGGGAVTLDPDLVALGNLGDGNPYRSGGAWSTRSNASLAAALGVGANPGITTVNGEGPDGSGNLVLSAADVGAQPADADLTGLANLGDGVPVRAAGTWAVASGTRDGTRFLRDDGTWQTPAGGGAGYTDEQVRDVIGAALVAGPNVTINASDVADTITISAATSGATGIPATIIDAKGDLIAGTANDTPGRLSIGTDGQALVANSATTTGLGWAAPTPAAHTHAATDLTSGTVATARLGSGTASSTTFLRGDNTWAAPPGASYTDEQAQDAAASLLTTGSHTGISFAYDDTLGRVNATVTGGGSGVEGATYTGNKTINGRFGVNATTSVRQPINMAATINGASISGTTDDKVGIELAPQFTGNFTGTGGSNPGFGWGLNLFATTGSSAGDGAGLTDLTAALLEMSLGTPSGTTFNVVRGLQAEAAFFGASAGCTVTQMESMRVSAPKRKDGATAGTATNAYGLFIESVDDYNVGATNKWSLFVEGGVSRFQGRLDIDQTIVAYGGTLELRGGYSGSGVINITSSNIGFFGVTPAARQTLPASGSVTAANIRTALIALGLCQ
jgi:hypothetical protein